MSLAVAAIAVTIAEVSGNLAFFYLGSLAAAYGVLMVLVRVVGAAFHRGDSELYRGK